MGRNLTNYLKGLNNGLVNKIYIKKIINYLFGFWVLKKKLLLVKV